MRHWLRVGGVAFALFAAGWGCTCGYAARLAATRPIRQCRANLHTLFVASRKVALAERQRGFPLAAVRRVLAGQYYLSPADLDYLRPGGRGPHRVSGIYTGPELEALVCPRDPEYGYKAARALNGSPAFQPSYRWNPDARTLAACPFHRIAVGRDGVIRDVR